MMIQKTNTTFQTQINIDETLEGFYQQKSNWTYSEITCINDFFIGWDEILTYSNLSRALKDCISAYKNDTSLTIRFRCGSKKMSLTMNNMDELEAVSRGLGHCMGFYGPKFYLQTA